MDFFIRNMVAILAEERLASDGKRAPGIFKRDLGAELIPHEAIRRRQPDRIAELARRFIGFVHAARARQ